MDLRISFYYNFRVSYWYRYARILPIQEHRKTRVMAHQANPDPDRSVHSWAYHRMAIALMLGLTVAQATAVSGRASLGQV
jgi:hypothetical protein